MDPEQKKSIMKKLIMTATLLLIYDTLEKIEGTQAILNFTILAQNVLYDEETLCYIEDVLYRLEKIKKVFEQH